MRIPGRNLLRFAGAILVLVAGSSCHRDESPLGILLDRGDFSPASESFERRLEHAFISTGAPQYGAEVDLVIAPDVTWQQVSRALDAIAVKGSGLVHARWTHGSAELQMALVDGNSLHWQYEFPLNPATDQERHGDVLLLFKIRSGQLYRSGQLIDLVAFNILLTEAKLRAQRVVVTFEIPDAPIESALEVLRYMEFAQKRGCRIHL